MMSPDTVSAARRALLRYLATIPALAATPSLAFGAAAAAAATAAPTAERILDLMEFEALARAALPPAHFGYLATGADDDRTVAINHEAYSRIEIRSHRFVDVSHLDTSVRLLGTTWASPVYLSAVSAQRAFHPEGEIATARAAKSRAALFMLSSGTSTGVETVTKERGGPVWMQLYATDDWAVTTALVKRAERAGCPVIALTADSVPGRKNETLQRAMRVDTRQCTDCHVNNSHDMWRRGPMFTGIDVSKVTGHTPSNLTWDYLDRLRQLVSVKLLVKGIVTGEDADKCVAHGVDGVIVSNHGGREEETLRSTIECLPEVVAAVAGRAAVLIDGGIRRGTDVFKALALGATAVGLGRPPIWGLAAFGQGGVEAALDIVNRELHAIMRHAGTPSIAAISRDYVVNRL